MDQCAGCKYDVSIAYPSVSIAYPNVSVAYPNPSVAYLSVAVYFAYTALQHTVLYFTGCIFSAKFFLALKFFSA